MSGAGDSRGRPPRKMEHTDAVRVFVHRPSCPLSTPSTSACRRFSVDPRLTNLDVLRSIIVRAFDIKSDYVLCYRKEDAEGKEVYLPLATDWDDLRQTTVAMCSTPLEEKRLYSSSLVTHSASDPQLRLILNVHEEDGGGPRRLSPSPREEGRETASENDRVANEEDVDQAPETSRSVDNPGRGPKSMSHPTLVCQVHQIVLPPELVCLINMNMFDINNVQHESSLSISGSSMSETAWSSGAWLLKGRERYSSLSSSGMVPSSQRERRSLYFAAEMRGRLMYAFVVEECYFVGDLDDVRE
ncbi:unnamed protein product [Cyprideis torosa]|uniref:Uncharacterized protein n=1 Tax=Cyprideis torosa TaxID=163714 RepID=A0A7R8WJA1_9CRUS|nr:unnamed protein product [Cyprideis torosa]CAG0895411.1 unnamed protein product [Cyprideis torosa]